MPRKKNSEWEEEWDDRELYSVGDHLWKLHTRVITVCCQCLLSLLRLLLIVKQNAHLEESEKINLKCECRQGILENVGKWKNGCVWREDCVGQQTAIAIARGLLVCIAIARFFMTRDNFIVAQSSCDIWKPFVLTYTIVSFFQFHFVLAKLETYIYYLWYIKIKLVPIILCFQQPWYLTNTKRKLKFCIKVSIFVKFAKIN